MNFFSSSLKCSLKCYRCEKHVSFQNKITNVKVNKKSYSKIELDSGHIFADSDLNRYYIYCSQCIDVIRTEYGNKKYHIEDYLNQLDNLNKERNTLLQENNDLKKDSSNLKLIISKNEADINNLQQDLLISEEKYKNILFNKDSLQLQICKDKNELQKIIDLNKTLHENINDLINSNLELKFSIEVYKKEIENLQQNYSTLNDMNTDLKKQFFLIPTNESQLSEISDSKLMISNLEDLENGWSYNFSQNYQQESINDLVSIGIIGIKQKGKTYLLSKLLDLKNPVHNTSTKGISTVIPKKLNQSVLFIDSEGSQSLINLYNKENLNNDGEMDLENKMFKEKFIDSFIISYSQIILMVVGSLTYSEQKKINKIWKESF